MVRDRLGGGVARGCRVAARAGRNRRAAAHEEAAAAGRPPRAARRLRRTSGGEATLVIGDAALGCVPALRVSTAGREVRALPGGPAGEREPPDPDPLGGGPAAAGAPPLRGGGRATAIASPDPPENDDDAVVGLARGVVEVEQAVRRYRRGARPVHVKPSVAAELGWRLCACGAGGVRPDAVVMFRGRSWHVMCALHEIALKAAA